MRCQDSQHSGSLVPSQASQACPSRGMARGIVSATCSSADFLYPTPSPGAVFPRDGTGSPGSTDGSETGPEEVAEPHAERRNRREGSLPVRRHVSHGISFRSCAGLSVCLPVCGLHQPHARKRSSGEGPVTKRETALLQLLRGELFRHVKTACADASLWFPSNPELGTSPHSVFRTWFP